MLLVDYLMNSLFDLAMAPFQTESPWPGLIAASLLTAFVLVGLFRLTSSQDGILRSRNRFLARTLELLLFQHDIRVSLTACGRILAANFVYLRHFLGPMLIGLIPLVLIFVQMDAWFGRRPLRVGEAAVLKATFRSAYPVATTAVTVNVPASVQIDSPPVRAPKTNEVAWRLIATADGMQPVEIQVAGVTEPKTLAVGSGLARVSARRESSGWLSQLFAPSEPPLAASGPIERLEVSYPPRRIPIGRTDFGWIITAVVLMMIFSLILGAVFGVRIA